MPVTENPNCKIKANFSPKTYFFHQSIEARQLQHQVFCCGERGVKAFGAFLCSSFIPSGSDLQLPSVAAAEFSVASCVSSSTSSLAFKGNLQQSPFWFYHSWEEVCVCLCLCCVSLLQSLADTWWFGGQELPESSDCCTAEKHYPPNLSLTIQSCGNNTSGVIYDTSYWQKNDQIYQYIYKNGEGSALLSCSGLKPSCAELAPSLSR